MIPYFPHELVTALVLPIFFSFFFSFSFLLLSFFLLSSFSFFLFLLSLSFSFLLLSSFSLLLLRSLLLSDSESKSDSESESDKELSSDSDSELLLRDRLCELRLRRLFVPLYPRRSSPEPEEDESSSSLLVRCLLRLDFLWRSRFDEFPKEEVSSLSSFSGSCSRDLCASSFAISRVRSFLLIWNSIALPARIQD